MCSTELGLDPAITSRPIYTDAFPEYDPISGLSVQGRGLLVPMKNPHPNNVSKVATALHRMRFRAIRRTQHAP